MELNITKLVQETTAKDYSASIAELGNDAGPITWNAAVNDASDYFNMTDEELEKLREYFTGFGGWANEEIKAWDTGQLYALLLQFISGDIREFSDEPMDTWNWSDYEREARRGTNSGRLFKSENEYFYSIDL